MDVQSPQNDIEMNIPSPNDIKVQKDYPKTPAINNKKWKIVIYALLCMLVFISIFNYEYKRYKDQKKIKLSSEQIMENIVSSPFIEIVQQEKRKNEQKQERLKDLAHQKPQEPIDPPNDDLRIFLESFDATSINDDQLCVLYYNNRNNQDIKNHLNDKYPKTLELDFYINDVKDIFNAITSENPFLINFLVKIKKVDINEKNGSLCPLMFAVANNLLNSVKILISLGANVNVYNAETGNTVLHIASLNENVGIVEEILNAGSLIDATNSSKNTSLMLAVGKNCLEVARLLIFKGCALNLQNDLGLTALHLAVSVNSFDLVDLLVNTAGCILDIKDNTFYTPLGIAKRKNFSKIRNFLKEKINK